MEDGSDLRNRVLVLEQRGTTLSESLQQLVKIVRGLSWELSGVLGELNAEVWRDRAERGTGEPVGQGNTRLSAELDQRLAILDSAIEELGKR